MVLGIGRGNRKKEKSKEDDQLDHEELMKELREAKQRFEILFENAPDPIYLTDMKGTFLDGNQAAEKLVGYKREELIGHSFLDLDLILKKELPRAAKGMARNLRGKPSGPERFTLKRKDGELVRVDVRSMPARISDKKVVIGIARDVTEDSQTEIALHKEQAYLDQLFESAQQAIVMCDQAGIVQRVNVQFCEMFGYLPSEATGKHIDELVTRVSEQDEAQTITDEVREGQHIHFEGRRFHRDGTPLEVSLHASPIIVDGEQLGVYAMYQDVTERKRAELTLKEQEEKFRTLFESAHDAFFIVDIDEQPPRFVECNTQTSLIFGCPKKDLIGRSPLEFSPPTQPCGAPSPDMAYKFLQAALEGMPQFFEWTHCRKDGTPFDAEVTLNRIEVKGKPYLQAIVRDVTERNRIQQALKNSNEELAQFIYTASHDLKTPAVSVSGYLGMLKELERDNLSEQGLQVMERMQEACNQMSSLLDDLASFTRMGRESYQMDIVEVGTLVKGLERELAPKIEATGALLVVPHELPVVTADPEGLELVLASIFDNALDYLGENPKPVVELLYEQIGEEHHFQVKDNGIGIESEYQDRVFEPFYALKDPRGGRLSSSGLGLSIARRVLEHHRGRLWLESDGQTGSSFHFTLPLTLEDQPNEEIRPLAQIEGDT